MQENSFSPHNLDDSAVSELRPGTQVALVLGAVLLILAEVVLVSSLLTARWLEHQVARELEVAKAEIASFGLLRYQHVKVSPWRRSIRILGVSFQPYSSVQPIRIEELSLSNIDWRTIITTLFTHELDLPRQLQASFKNMRVSPDFFGSEGAQVWHTLGYDDFNLSGSVNLRIDRPQESLQVDNLNLYLKDAGHLSISLLLAKIPIPSLNEIRTGLTSAASSFSIAEAALRSLEISYEDASLLRRLSEALLQEGKPGLDGTVSSFKVKSESREVASHSLAGSSPGQLKLSAFTSTSLNKLKEFSRNPGFIRLRMAPDHDFSFVGLAQLAYEASSEMDVEYWAHRLHLDLEIGQQDHDL